MKGSMRNRTRQVNPCCAKHQVMVQTKTERASSAGAEEGYDPIQLNVTVQSHLVISDEGLIGAEIFD